MTKADKTSKQAKSPVKVKNTSATSKTAGLEASALAKAAEERSTELPDDSDERTEAIEDIIKLVKEHSEDDGGEIDFEAVLIGLEHEFGLKVSEEKKRKAEVDARPDIGKRPNTNREPVEWPFHAHGSSARELAERMRLEALKKNIAIPEDEEQAIVVCGQAVTFAKTERDTCDVLKALQHLQEKFGLHEVKERNYVGDIKVPENAHIVEMLRELAASYFKMGNQDRQNRIKGAMLQRAGTAVRDLEWQITPEHMPTAKKGKDKIPNVGHDTIEYIRELFETGKVTRLEEHKIQDAKKK